MIHSERINARRKTTLNKVYIAAIMNLALLISAACSQAPKVSHVWPDAGMNGSSVTAHIYGVNFDSPSISSVNLRRAGCPDVSATSLTIHLPTYLTCSFQFSWDSTGPYDLVVTSDSGSDTLPRCYTVYSASPSPGSWTRTVVWSADTSMYGLAVGDGDGDWKTEVYGASVDSYVYGFTWDGAVWLKDTLGSGTSYIMGVAIGDGNEDNEIEVYAANLAFTLYQFKWGGMTWEKTAILGPLDSRYGVTVGDGNGDGQTEVYSFTIDGRIHQYQWEDTVWTYMEVGSGLGWLYEIAIGDADGDGRTELHAASGDGDVYHFTWNGAVWQEVVMDSSGAGKADIAVGDGDSDGVLEVYVAAGDRSIYQYQWTGAYWARTVVGTAGSFPMSAVAIGDGDGDGDIEVYGASWDDSLYQFEWDGMTWVKTTVGLCGPAEDIAVGDGNADGLMEIYGVTSYYDHRVYQFRYEPVGVAEKDCRTLQSPVLELSVSPIPAPAGVRISYSLPDPTEVCLSVYDVSGRLVKNLVNAREESGSKVVRWDGTDSQERRVTSGTYFARLEASGLCVSRKLIIL